MHSNQCYQQPNNFQKKFSIWDENQHSGRYNNVRSSRSIRLISAPRRRADSSKNARHISSRQIVQEKSPRNSTNSPLNWMSSLNEVAATPRKRSNSFNIPSPNAYLLFPSPHSPTTRTPRTLRKIIDDSGFHVLKESPLSARDSYYSPDLNLDINGKTISDNETQISSPDFEITPSPRAMSMRNNHQTFLSQHSHKETNSLNPEITEYHKEKSIPLPKLENRQNKTEFDDFFDLSVFNTRNIEQKEVDELEMVDCDKIIDHEELDLNENYMKSIPNPPIFKSESIPSTRSPRKTNKFKLPAIEQDDENESV